MCAGNSGCVLDPDQDLDPDPDYGYPPTAVGWYGRTVVGHFTTTVLLYRSTMDGARGVVYTSDFTSIFHAKVNRVGGRIRLVRYGTVRYGTVHNWPIYWSAMWAWRARFSWIIWILKNFLIYSLSAGEIPPESNGQ